jgi:hypothetical protein
VWYSIPDLGEEVKQEKPENAEKVKKLEKVKRQRKANAEVTTLYTKIHAEDTLVNLHQIVQVKRMEINYTIFNCVID